MTFINQESVGRSGMHWFFGTVEDRDDPHQLGRVKVRVHGYHTDDESLIPTNHLPWAIVLGSTGSPGVSGVGDTPRLMVGAQVVGWWMDWPDCQIPAVLGTMNQREFHPGLAESTSLSRPDMKINDHVHGAPGVVEPVGDGPPWLQVARGELTKGVREWPGSGHNPEVLKYGEDLGFKTDDSQHPWCAAFVRWCVKAAGLPVGGLTGMAKSSLVASSMERLETPIYGCIAVKHRSAALRNSPQGHVGFWVGRSGGKDRYLGGNQGNRVSVATYSVNAHAGYMWPKGHPKEGFDGAAMAEVPTVDEPSQA